MQEQGGRGGGGGPLTRPAHEAMVPAHRINMQISHDACTHKPQTPIYNSISAWPRPGGWGFGCTCCRRHRLRDVRLLLRELDGRLQRGEYTDANHYSQDVAALRPSYFEAEIDVHGDDESADDCAGGDGAKGEVGGGDGGGVRGCVTLLLLPLLMHLILLAAIVRVRLQQGAGLEVT